MAWDALYEAQPTDSTYVADTDDAIRSTKTEIRTRVAKEHGFNLSESSPQTGHGKHLRGSARAFVSDTSVADPTTVTTDDADYGTGRLQVYPTLKRLGYYSGSAWIDLIRNSSGQLFSEVATGTAPMVVASTTRVTNLNADMLDGAHAGNASGNIPVSNGTTCTNLSAEFLQGWDVGSGTNNIPIRGTSSRLKGPFEASWTLGSDSKTGNSIYDDFKLYYSDNTYMISGVIRELSTAKTLILRSVVVGTNITFYGANMDTWANDTIVCTNGSSSSYFVCFNV